MPLENSFAPLFVCHRLWDWVWAAVGYKGPELKIMVGQWTMSGLIEELTGQPFVLLVMLTGHNYLIVLFSCFSYYLDVVSRCVLRNFDLKSRVKCS